MENVKGKILAKTLMQHVCMMAGASAKQSQNSDNNSIGQQAEPCISNVLVWRRVRANSGPGPHVFAV